MGVIRLAPDTPEPRCLGLNPDQQLRLVNVTRAEVVTVDIAAYHAKLAPGKGVTFRKPVGSYLASGDHLVHVSTYAGGGAEVLVRAG